MLLFLVISAVCVCFQEYSLRVQSGFVPDQSHYVTKRYSDFAALDTVLRSYGMDFSLPPKKVFGKMDSDFIEERQRGLQVVS